MLLFLADVHLSDENPALTEFFLSFLRTRARAAEAVYILGDLFETWLGDDDDSQSATAARQALQTLTGQDVQVFLQHGNRDFLLGHTFCRQTGCTLLPEFARVPLGRDNQALLLHGDQLCLQDQAYQAFRRQVRDVQWQRVFLDKPLGLRRAIAEQARRESTAHVQSATQAVLEIAQAEVERIAKAQGVERLIHGHIHQSGWHEFALDGNPAQRVVVGDWRATEAVILVWEGEQGQLETIMPSLWI